MSIGVHTAVPTTVVPTTTIPTAGQWVFIAKPRKSSVKRNCVATTGCYNWLINENTTTTTTGILILTVHNNNYYF